MAKQFRMGSEQRLVFFRSLATMFRAGVPINKALELLEEQFSDREATAVLVKISERVRSGHYLSRAMSSCPGVFTQMQLHLVGIAENSGTLDVVLHELAGYEEKQRALLMKVKNAITYPAITLTISLVLLVWLPPFLMDGYFKMITESGQELPLLTKLMLNFSNLMHSPWLYLALGCLAVVSYFWLPDFLERPAVKTRLAHLTLRIPSFGNLLRVVATARFARALAVQARVGVNPLVSIPLSAEASGNPILSQRSGEAVEALKDGATMEAALEQVEFFPDMLVQMVRAGEESASLPKMLLKLADLYQLELDHTIDTATALLEPLIMALMGLIVGAFVIASALPMTTLLQDL